MKVDRVSSVTPTRTRRSERGSASGTGSFAEALAPGETPAPSSVSAGAAIGRVDALLALQEVSNDPDAPSRGRRRGEALLDHLEELRLGLLTGGLSRAVVERLANLVAEKRAQVDDPRLAAILDDIELRAAVELAKLRR